jgi:hypothetical protein
VFLPHLLVESAFVWRRSEFLTLGVINRQDLIVDEVAHCMSSPYTKQMSWKASTAANTANAAVKDDDLTYQPKIYTQSDFSKNKYKVAPRTKELTINAGSLHVERYERARQAKAEGERKLYGMGKAKPVQTLRSGYSANMLGPNIFKRHSRPTSAEGDTGDADAQVTTNESIEEGSVGQQSEQHSSKAKKPEEQSASEGKDSIGESNGVHRGGYSVTADSPVASNSQPTSVTLDEDILASPQGQMTVKDMEEHLSIVQVLEKERREWHAERAKLTHCVHLQQVELASRSAAAQETAALIAKEFARVIEGFEERLLKVETANEREIGQLKSLVAELLARKG